MSGDKRRLAWLNSMESSLEVMMIMNHDWAVRLTYYVPLRVLAQCAKGSSASGREDLEKPDKGQEVVSRAAFLGRLSQRESETQEGNDIKFNLNNLVEFKDQDVLHSAHNPPAPESRKRPNYNSKERSSMRILPADRRQYLRSPISLTFSCKFSNSQSVLGPFCWLISAQAAWEWIFAISGWTACSTRVQVQRRLFS